MTTPEQAPPQTNPNDRQDHTNERLARLEEGQRFLTDIVREIRQEQRDTNKRIDTLIFVTIGAAATITAAIIGIGIAIILTT